jgi:hypothetical protein
MTQQNTVPNTDYTAVAQNWFQLRLQTWDAALRGTTASTPFGEKLKAAEELFQWAIQQVDTRMDIGLDIQS